MSDNSQDARQCELIQDDLPELALGTLYGRSRSEVLDHVQSCARCAAELERLSIVADTLIQLAPEIEPPLGFELRVAERLQASTTAARPRRLRRTSALCAAAAAIVVLGFGLGTVTAHHDHYPEQSATAGLTSAPLTSNGHVLGEAMLTASHPVWMFMTIDDGTWSGRVTCEVTLADGQVQSVGSFTLSGGYGAWGARLTSAVGKVRSARLVASDGNVLATAQIAT
jgi:hypothetical protein